MEQINTDPVDSGNPTDQPGEESLSAYVQRMETDENLRKLATKLKDDLEKPVENEHPDVPRQNASTPDLSFGKFEEKRKRGDGQ